jgi:transcription elongation GreA/GreB family factor
LVALTSNGKKSIYFLIGESGGLVLTMGGVSVNVISTQSPLGQALIASQQGDWIEVQRKGVTQEYEVVSVR